MRTVSLKVASPLAVISLIYLVRGMTEGLGLDFDLYAFAAIVGAGRGAYAVAQFRR